MIAPPRMATWLLESTLATSDGDAVAGDLYEEFNAYIVPQRGLWLARWWYRWQVARSLAPLFWRSWERASIARASTAVISGAAAATLPAWLLVLLRGFVLQQVPLKTTSELSAGFAVLLVLVVSAAAAAGCATALQIVNAERRER
jgi:hypothetical protein